MEIVNFSILILTQRRVNAAIQPFKLLDFLRAQDGYGNKEESAIGAQWPFYHGGKPLLT